MYKFIDTNEVSEDILPSEALRINGQFIEELVNGYRTLSVSGREAHSPEISIYGVGTSDGSEIMSKRYPERVITVKYQLMTKSSEEFREAYNKLGGILNFKDAELVFNDELDKFFKGTIYEIGEVEPGKNTVTGEFSILCNDPFKYSIVEYEAESFLEDNSIMINYGGTQKSFPKLEAEFYKESESDSALTGKGDCGYIAFFDENSNIIQLGDPDEKDTEEGVHDKSQTLTSQTFDKSDSLQSATQWTKNKSGLKYPLPVVLNGTAGMKIASYAVPKVPASTSGTLTSVWSDYDEPKFLYNVSAKTSGRTANSINVVVSVTTALRYDGSYFGYGFSLIGALYIGGAWHSVTLKTTNEWWQGRTAHVANFSFTISGLSASTAVLTEIKFRVSRGDSVGGGAGLLSEKGCNNLAISKYEASVPDTYMVSASDYGTGEGTHGVSINRDIPNDESGQAGARDFTFTYKHKMCLGKTSQLGSFQSHIFTASGEHIAGVTVSKSTIGNNAKVGFYVKGVEVFKTNVDISANNPYFGNGGGTTTITKSGGLVTFNVSGIKNQITEPLLAETKAGKVSFVFEQYASGEPLEYNGVYLAKFVKNNCDTWRNIPNKFSANDIAVADCKDGKVYLNGVHCPEYGALGNDWESFYLTPGINQIGVSYSEWVQKDFAPKFKVKYREVFL